MLFKKRRGNFSAGIIGLGSHYPPRAVSNQELESLKVLETSDEWISTKLGIKSRRFARSDKALSDIAIPAAKEALADAGLSGKDLDVIIVGAMSHDYIAGILTGNIIKEAIGAENAYAIDVNIICAGFIYCTELAASMIESGRAKNVLIVNGEVFSKYPHSRVTSVIFGDGAGAAVLTRVKEGSGLLKSSIHSRLEGADNLGVFAGGSRKMFPRDTQDPDDFKIFMNGRAIFEFATRAFSTAITEVLEAASIPIDKVDWVFSHQANINIIKTGMESLGIPMQKTITNIDKYGNIGGGSVTTVLNEAKKKGRLKRGDLIVNVAFGSGLAWGANVMRWCSKDDVLQ